MYIHYTIVSCFLLSWTITITVFDVYTPKVSLQVINKFLQCMKAWILGILKYVCGTISYSSSKGSVHMWKLITILSEVISITYSLYLFFISFSWAVAFQFGINISEWFLKCSALEYILTMIVNSCQYSLENYNKYSRFISYKGQYLQPRFVNINNVLHLLICSFGSWSVKGIAP
jgi:hypothetical protein